MAGGASANHTIAHVLEGIAEKAFRAKLTDVTSKLGVLSIQGPKSREILQKITNFDLTCTSLSPNSTQVVTLNLNEGRTCSVRVLRVSFVGELGYELHIPIKYCEEVFNVVMNAGSPIGLRNAGYRSLYSLSSEKGFHLWGYDLRADDSPIEANLGFVCRKEANYKGAEKVVVQRTNGVEKRLAYFTIDEQLPIWGLEAVYRNGKIVGHLRRGEYAYYLQKPIGQAYITNSEGKFVDKDYLTSGKYQIEIMGKLYDAKCLLRSPFDPKGRRIQGIYD